MTASPAGRASPESYMDLVALFGAETADLLVDHFGGQNLYVPKSSPNDDHPLVVCLGRARAAEVVAVFYGSHPYIPNLKILRIVNKVLVLKEQGYTVAQISRIIDRSEQRIWQILREHRNKDDRQADLFV